MWFAHLKLEDIPTWEELANPFVEQYKFNIDVALTRLDLQRMKKKDSESFRQYVKKWRDKVAQVRPSLTDYLLLLSMTTTTFYDLILVG